MTTRTPRPPTEYDDPHTLAALVAAAPRPLLIGLDIDGVLSPIVAHADDSRLLAGVADVLVKLGDVEGVHVAVISGRALSSMQTFGLPASVRLVGSHGMENGATPMTPLDADETVRLETLSTLSHDAAARAGGGAWVEHKRASVALHVREADADLGHAALNSLADSAQSVPGAHAKPGSQVLELFARDASKGTALTELRAVTHAATTVFVGDDITDEDAFETLVAHDVNGIAIKVGDAATLATHRLPDPPAVLAWLDEVVRRGQNSDV